MWESIEEMWESTPLPPPHNTAQVLPSTLPHLLNTLPHLHNTVQHHPRIPQLLLTTLPPAQGTLQPRPVIPLLLPRMTVTRRRKTRRMSRRARRSELLREIFVFKLLFIHFCVSVIRY